MLQRDGHLGGEHERRGSDAARVLRHGPDTVRGHPVRRRRRAVRGHLRQGGTIWLSRRSKRPEVGYFVQRGSPIDTALPQGGWTPLGRLRIALSEAAQRSGALVLSPAPKFLWVTEFPLFTRADEDKEFLAHGRWSSSHHPFTAPMYEDIEKMLAKDVEDVSHSSAPRFHQSDSF